MQYRHLYMARISFVVIGKKLDGEIVQNQTTKSSQKKLQNRTINLSSYIFRVHNLILLPSFFIHFVVELFPVV